MMTLLTVLGGLAAAGLGAWVSYLLGRARPQVTPTSIRRTVEIIPHGSVVEPNSELLTTCGEHPFLEGPPFEGIGKVDERTYVSFLTRTQERVEDYVRVQLPAIAERAQQLQMKLAADDFEGVAHIWIDASDRLWGYAEGAFVRNEYSLSPRPSGPPSAIDSAAPTADDIKSDDGSGQLADECYVATGSDGSTLVFYPGFVLPLRFSPNPRAGLGGIRSEELAQRLSEAFAHRKKSDLIKVFNFLSGIDREIPRLEAISQRIAEELKLMTRLSVTALISNAGGSPISISKQACTVNLFLGGYRYNVEDDDAGKPREQRDDIELEMSLVDNDGYPNPPITIEGGGARSITAVYRTPLTAEILPNGGSLYELLESALKGAERNWQLKIDAVLQRSASKQLSSRKISFRDIHPLETDGGRLRQPERDTHIDALGQWTARQEKEIGGMRSELATLRAEMNQLLASLQTQGDGSPSQATARQADETQQAN